MRRSTRKRGIAPGLPSFDDLHGHLWPGQSQCPDCYLRRRGRSGGAQSQSADPQQDVFAKWASTPVYVPFRVNARRVGGFLKSFDILPVRGYSVTIPHKEDGRHASHPGDPATTQIQAANTLATAPRAGWTPITPTPRPPWNRSLLTCRNRRTARRGPCTRAACLCWAQVVVAKAIAQVCAKSWHEW